MDNRYKVEVRYFLHQVHLLLFPILCNQADHRQIHHAKQVANPSVG